MSWRVVCKYRYSELYFDFETLQEAGEFVRIMLTHYQGDDNLSETNYLSLKIIPNTKKEED